MFKVFLWYLIGINIYTYLLFYVDKQKAKKEKRRISEHDLLKFSLLGGIIGALIAMKNFRHKTQKKEFYYRIYTIAGIYILLIIFIIFKLMNIDLNNIFSI